MLEAKANGRPICVALRKESVDRNRYCLCYGSAMGRSLSARRAWIEMAISAVLELIPLVALRKESVDRNTLAACIVPSSLSRSPQGERG